MDLSEFIEILFQHSNKKMLLVGALLMPAVLGVVRASEVYSYITQDIRGKKVIIADICFI